MYSTGNGGVDPLDDRGLATCPDCETELDPAWIEGERPMQTVAQHCPECDETMLVGMCWYPDGRYVIVAEALEDDGCTFGVCTEDAIIRHQDVFSQLTEGRCEIHAESHLLRTYEERVAASNEGG